MASCNGYYKLNYPDSDTLSSSDFIECLATLDDCFEKNANYYDTDAKKCWTSFPSGYYIKNEVIFAQNFSDFINYKMLFFS